MKRGESGWTNCKGKGQERTLPGWPFLFFCVLIYIGDKQKRRYLAWSNKARNRDL